MNKVYSHNNKTGSVTSFSIDTDEMTVGYRDVFVGTILYEPGGPLKREIVLEESMILPAFNYFLRASQVHEKRLPLVEDPGDFYPYLENQAFNGFYVRYYDIDGKPFRVNFE